MTSISDLLRQAPALRRRAFECTRDTNEAYLLVHDVMTSAIGGGDKDDNFALIRAMADSGPRLCIDAAPA
ncbi:MAG: hypothetical protein JNM59_06415 [Hyphomonadaceae bacterium]|nr:hypothetical protein [Hyphomonadaceae bacterium]